MNTPSKHLTVDDAVEDKNEEKNGDKGDDRYTVAYDSTLPTVGLWRFPVRYSWEPTPLDKRRVFLFTDRSLYRPGETVQLKNGDVVELAGTQMQFVQA